MKNFKRIISTMLVACMAISMTSGAAGAQKASEDKGGDMKVLAGEISANGVRTELSAQDGDLYYFEDTQEYTMNISKYSNGQISISKKIKSNPSIINSVDISMDNTFNKTLRESDISVIAFQGIRDAVNLGQIELTEEIIFSDGILAYQSEAEIVSKIDRALAREYEPMYGSTLRNSMIAQGERADLYESLTYYRANNKLWNSIGGMAITVASTVISWPVSAIQAAFTIYFLANGTKAIIDSAIGHEYDGDLIYDKGVKINAVYPYRAGKSIRNKVLVGDKDAVIQYVSTSKDFDYDDNTALLARGIELYKQYN